ncbi:tagatose-6-phosphate kinase [Aerococcaceae bacterium 50-4]
MILTVTLNPSIDISYTLPYLKLDTTNRTAEVNKTAGGKGINVTRVIHDLKKNVLASGLIGGNLGKAIIENLNEVGIKSDFYPISGETRNCIAILHEGQQTEILESGPTITAGESMNFLTHFKDIATQADVITISGSLPKGLSDNYYAKMIQIACDLDKVTVLDTSKTYLSSALESPFKPTVIKPNIHELSELLNKEVSANPTHLKTILENDLFSEIEWIVVSLGADGAFAKHNNKFYKVSIPSIPVVNPVGSGDATVAGIASALEEQLDDINLLKQAMTTGMLNTMESITGHIDINHFDNLFNRVTVTEY